MLIEQVMMVLEHKEKRSEINEMHCDFMSCCGSRDAVFLLLQISVSYSAPRDLRRRAAYLIYESSFLIHHSGYHDLFVCP